MKVIALNGSPHAQGTTYRGIQTIAGELEQAGIGCEILQVGGGLVPGCRGCGACRELKRCIIDDDGVNRCREQLADAQGIILGSPVYYGGIAGTFKCFLDRLFFTGPDLRFMVGATVTALRRSGGVAAHHALNNYLHLAQVIITPSPYWEVVHGTSAQELVQDEEGLQILRTVGRNMAWLIKVQAAVRKEHPLPPMERRIRTNFIR